MAGIVAVIPEFLPVRAGDWFAFGVSGWRRVCGDGASCRLGPPRSRATDADLLFAGSALERRAHLSARSSPQRHAVLSLPVSAPRNGLHHSVLRGRAAAQKARCPDRLDPIVWDEMRGNLFELGDSVHGGCSWRLSDPLEDLA